MSSTGRFRANGEGTIFRRGDGRWVVECYVLEAVTGRRVRRTVYAKTAAEAENTLVELRRQATQGTPSAPSGLTVAAYLAEWLDQVVAVRVRPNTLAHYRYNVDKYLVPALGARRLGRLSAREVRALLDTLRSQGAGARTIQYVHATLRAALEDAVREEMLPRNVAKLVRVPSPPKTERRPLTIDEVRQLLAASREHRLHAMLVVFALVGLRRSEVLGLQWDDLEVDDHPRLHVRRGLQRIDGELRLLPTKTTGSRRVIPLPVPVAEALRQHRDRQAGERATLGAKWPDLGYVFTTPIGTPIDPRNCTRVVQDLCASAGLRVVRLHDFRHGCVSVLLSLGVPPRTTMEIVGHSTLEMTMTVYGHVSLDDKTEAMRRLGSLLTNDAEG